MWERRDHIVQNVGLNDTTLPPSPPSLTFIPPLPYLMYKMSGQISIHHTSWFHWERRDYKLSGHVLSFTYKMGAEGQNVVLNQYAPYLLHLQNSSIYNMLTLQLRRSLQVKSTKFGIRVICLKIPSGALGTLFLWNYNQLHDILLMQYKIGIIWLFSENCYQLLMQPKIGIT